MWILEYLVDIPAKEAGYALGLLLHTFYLIASFGVSAFAGYFVHRWIPVPVLSTICGFIIGLWLLLLFSQAERFIALGILESVVFEKPFSS